MAVLAIAALVGLAVWLVVESVSVDDGGTATTPQTSEPVAVSVDGLTTLAGAAGGPIYWVGPGQATRYELRQSDGQVYVRYLPDGVQPGDPRPLLTVATYALENAYDVTSKIQGSEQVPIAGGGVAVLSSERPTSAYVAFPGVDYQIEVFDPDASTVRELATSGTVQPVPAAGAAGNSRGPEAVTESELVSLSKELGQPLYWAGPRENTTYELTVTVDGRIFVRYLPPKVEVGARPGALTVATYPVADAYSITEQGGSGEGSTVVEIPDGGIAAYTKGEATNVYLAYPGEDVQVELYSPVPGVAPKLASQGKIVPVG
jgi:hypothetical protein